MSDKKKPFQVYLYDSERKALGEKAKAKGESVNVYLRTLINNHLKRAK